MQHTFGPKDLKRLVERVVDDINPDGTLPDDKLQADRRHFTLHSDAGRWVCGGVPADRRGRGEAAGRAGAVGEAADQCHRDRRRAGGWRSPTIGRYGQRMHDALEQLCDRMLRTDTAVPDAGGTPATVIITFDLADLLDKTGYAFAGPTAR